MLLSNELITIHEIQPPKNKKQLRIFIGIINCYRCMWKGRAGKLTPLVESSFKQAKWQHTEMEQKACEGIRATVAKNTLVVYQVLTSLKNTLP
eukprot:5244928-Ditylum_brightwellii.AAC.1